MDFWPSEGQTTKTSIINGLATLLLKDLWLDFLTNDMKGDKGSSKASICRMRF